MFVPPNAEKTSVPMLSPVATAVGDADVPRDLRRTKFGPVASVELRCAVMFVAELPRTLRLAAVAENTSRRVVGEVVPIPTFVPSSYTTDAETADVPLPLSR